MNSTDSLLSNNGNTVLSHPHVSATLSPSMLTTDVFELVCNATAEEIESVLRLQGINVDIQNDKGDTLLIVAARRGDETVVQMLLSCGASLHIRNFKGSNCLIAAAMKGHAHICSLLLNYGADVNQATDSSDTALSLAIWQNHTDVCLLLMAAGANVDNIDKFGDTMLLDAAKHGNVSVMTALLQKQTLSINHANKKGETALIRAAWRGQLEPLRLLLANGASVSICDTNGHNALCMSALQNHRECFMEMLQYCSVSDIDFVYESGYTPLFYLASFAPARSSGAHDDLFWAGITAIIEGGGRVDYPANIGSILLCRSANANQLSTVRALLLRGTNVNYGDPSNKFRPPLLAHLQISNDLEMVELLLAHGAILDAQDSEGSTALIIAVRRNLVDIVRILLDHGASIFMETKHKETALSIATANVNFNPNSTDVVTTTVISPSDAAACLQLLVSHMSKVMGPSALLIHAASHADIDSLTELIARSRNENSRTVNETPKNHSRYLSDIEECNEPMEEDQSLSSTEPNLIFKNVQLVEQGHLVPHRRHYTDNTELEEQERIDLNFADASGRTALIHAARCGSLACVRLLLAEGVHTALSDRDGQTALGHAILNGHKEVAALLAQHTEAKLRNPRYSTTNGDGRQQSSSASSSTELDMVTQLLVKLGNQLSDCLTRYKDSKLST